MSIEIRDKCVQTYNWAFVVRDSLEVEYTN